MADYTIAVSWSGKDALADSDANKVISGADFNTEFTTVQTAVNSKADTASPTLTGTPAAPTASVATDTTQLATTAFVKDVLENYIYPVGSIYFNMAVSTNPGTLLGFGTWAAYAEGRVLVGFQSSGTFDALDESLGAETAAHTLTESEMPSHYHDSIHGGSTSGRPDSFVAISNSLGGSNFGGGTDDDDWGSSRTKTAGSGSAHSHSTLQPSKTLYIWKRTA
jgi:hypothetical protein